MKKSLII